MSCSQLYEFQSAGTATVSGKALLNWFMVAATAVTSYRPFAAYKLKRVQMWGPPIVSTTSNTGTLTAGISVEWYGPSSGWQNSEKFTALPCGVEPAYLDVRPPKKSTLSDWIQSGSADGDTTNTLIAFGGLLGSVVKTHFDVKLVDDETPYGAEAPVGATVGKSYYNYLDGRSSGVIQPYSVNIVP